MPIDMALPLFLSTEDFVYRKSSKTCDPDLRIQTPQHQDQAGPEVPEPSRKKQVTFADHRGLPLTRVRVFSPLQDPVVPLKVQETLRLAPPPPAAQEDHLVLDFPQPTRDYLRFHQDLEQNLVSLEHVVLKSRTLGGTVKVKNVSFSKSVRLRVTFDGWRTQLDLDCEYLKDAYPSMHCDTFSFSVALPAPPLPHDGVEFAVLYEVDGRQHWDSNHGNNYRLVWASRKTRTRDLDYGIHLDRYGSPTCSHGLFPDWSSYAGYENMGPYY